MPCRKTKLLNGWSYNKKRGASRLDRIPTAFVDEIQIEGTDDYIKLLPLRAFTTKRCSNPSILNSHDSVCHLRNLWIMRNHNNSLMKFLTGHFKKSYNIIAGLTIQIS